MTHKKFLFSQINGFMNKNYLNLFENKIVVFKNSVLKFYN